MKKFSVLVAMMLLVAACGGDAGESADTTAESAETTMATETTVMVEETTSSAAETTTTSAAEETTTTAAATSSEAKGLDALLTSTEPAGQMTSGRIEGVMSIQGVEVDDSGTLTSIEVPFTTMFDTEANAFSMIMDMSGMAGAVPSEGDPLAEMMLTEFELRQIGDESYVKMPFLSAMLGSDAEWMLMPADQSDAFTADMGVQTDPYEMLDDYRDANAQVEDLGTETVNGVQATHYHVVVDGESYAASLSDEERASLEQNGPLPTGEFPLDIWISEDGFVVRMVMEVDGTQAEFEGGESFESMSLTYDVFDINEPIEIVAPDDFVDMSELGGAFGDTGN